jgi:ribosome maturation factor RimP
MYKEEAILELEDILRSYLDNRQIELIELIHRREGSNLVLRIIVDRPQGGITLDDCTFLNKELGRILDERDLIQDRYILEVSSPGLDRPLVNKKDFTRCMNKKIKIFLNEPVLGKIELDGIIKNVSDDNISLEVRGEITEIEFSKINKAKQIFL